MKRFLLKLFLFLTPPAILGGGWTVFVAAADYRSYSSALAAPDGAEVLVCGDSQTKDALDPSIVPRLFNFSTAATTCDQDFMRLCDLLEANRGKFKYVLLDVSPLKIGYNPSRPVSELNAARVHALLHLYHISSNARPFGSLGALWRDVICIRKFNEFRKALLRGKPWRSSMAGAFAPDKAKGFLDPKFRTKALADIEEKAMRVNSRPPADESLPLFDILGKSIGIVRTYGAKPVVTVMPLSKPLLQRIDHDRLAAFEDAVLDVSRHMDVELIDCLRCDLPDELWHDGNHLNKDGAKVFSAIFAEKFAAAAARSAVPGGESAPKAEFICEIDRTEGPCDLSGIARTGGDEYWSSSDSRGRICRVRIPVDRASGAISGFEVLENLDIPGGNDLEGLAWDPLRKSLWVSDERVPAIIEFRPGFGLTGESVALPREFLGIKDNRGLESLEMSQDGTEMWTCNENSLTSDDSASIGGHEFLRLTRFSRKEAGGKWRLSGQWAYRPESPGGTEDEGGNRNGVASLCPVPGLGLLVLERECGAGDDGDSFIARLYLADTSCATDVRGWTSLGDKDFTPVDKHLVFKADTGHAMYEGACPGPVLDDGSATVVLISDGDGSALEKAMILRLRR